MMLTTLLRASVEGAVLVAAIWSVGRLWPRLSARTQTVLWWCATAKFLFALAWIAPIELRVLPAAPAVLSAAVERSFSPEGSGVVAPANGVPLPSGDGAGRSAWPTVVLGVWTIGVVLMCAMSLRRWRTMAAIVADSDAADENTTRLVGEVADALRLRRTPQVRVSGEVRTPLVVGLARPTVVLPADRYAALSEDEQRMTLCHELAHVKRADLWLGLVPALAERVFFFHPLARLAAREYALCREAACDATVIATLDPCPRDYGRLLLTLGVAPERTVAAAAGASWSFSILKRRISMLRDVSNQSRATGIAAASVVAIAVVALVPMRLSARPETPAVPAVRPVGAASAAPAAPGADARREPQEQELHYVMFLGDVTQISGSSRDVETARRYRNVERLLWFRNGNREYVVRDPSVMDEVLALWKPVSEMGEEQGKLGARQGALGAKQGEIGARQGAIGAEQGMLGAKQAALGARQAALAGRELTARTEAERRAVDDEHRRIDQEMRALDRQMGELDARMREADHPMDDLSRQMEGLGREMDALGKKMDEAGKQAEAGMRALIERAIANGTAVPVK